MKPKSEKSKGTGIKAVLFDLGNVLIHYDVRPAIQAFADVFGVSPDRVLEVFFLSDLEKAYTKGEISTDDFFQKVSALFPNQIEFALFAKLWNEIFTLNHEMEELVIQLKNRYPLYLISNTNDLHFEYVLEHYPVLRHFTKHFPSHWVGRRKPEPEIFLHVLSEIGLKPEETVFIDDVQEFVTAAERVGIHGIRFTTRAALEGELRVLGVVV